MLYTSPVDALENAIYGLISPSTSSLSEIAAALSLSTSTFSDMMSDFASDAAAASLPGHRLSPSFAECPAFSGNEQLIKALRGWGLLLSADAGGDKDQMGGGGGGGAGAGQDAFTDADLEDDEEEVGTALDDKQAGGEEEGDGSESGGGGGAVFAAAEKEDEEDSLVDFDKIIEDLCDMFKEKNGRDPTTEEVQMWLQTMREGMSTNAGDGETELLLQEGM